MISVTVIFATLAVGQLQWQSSEFDSEDQTWETEEMADPEARRTPPPCEPLMPRPGRPIRDRVEPETSGWLACAAYQRYRLGVGQVVFGSITLPFSALAMMPSFGLAEGNWSSPFLVVPIGFAIKSIALMVLGISQIQLAYRMVESPSLTRRDSLYDRYLRYNALRFRMGLLYGLNLVISGLGITVAFAVAGLTGVLF